MSQDDTNLYSTSFTHLWTLWFLRLCVIISLTDVEDEGFNSLLPWYILLVVDWLTHPAGKSAPGRVISSTFSPFAEDIEPVAVLQIKRHDSNHLFTEINIPLKRKTHLHPLFVAVHLVDEKAPKRVGSRTRESSYWIILQLQQTASTTRIQRKKSMFRYDCSGKTTWPD